MIVFIKDPQSLGVVSVSGVSVLCMKLIDKVQIFAPIVQSVIQITIGLLTIVFLIYKIKHIKNGKRN